MRANDLFLIIDSFYCKIVATIYSCVVWLWRVCLCLWVWMNGKQMRFPNEWLSMSVPQTHTHSGNHYRRSSAHRAKQTHESQRKHWMRSTNVPIHFMCMLKCMCTLYFRLFWLHCHKNGTLFHGENEDLCSGKQLVAFIERFNHSSLLWIETVNTLSPSNPGLMFKMGNLGISYEFHVPHRHVILHRRVHFKPLRKFDVTG